MKVFFILLGLISMFAVSLDSTKGCDRLQNIPSYSFHLQGLLVSFSTRSLHRHIRLSRSLFFSHLYSIAFYLVTMEEKGQDMYKGDGRAIHPVSFRFL
ncbi:MAG: hypothetical protein M0C28_12095 [Candidatus Moduliflexus flocculans]|nr:hypothetical protein [Candidatus Moduliflexus flocculans]